MSKELFWKILRLIATPFLIACAVAYIFVLFYVLISFIYAEYPAWISGETVSPPNYVRNALELIYFVSNSIVAIIAVLAIRFASKQAREAENARLAALYTTIEARWASDDIKRSRRYFRDLMDEYQRAGHYIDLDAFPRFVHQKLRTLSLVNPFQYMEAMSIVDFLEYLGMMEHRKYLKIGDLEPLIGEVVISVENVVSHHIGELRAAYRAQAVAQGRTRVPPTYERFTDLADKYRTRFR